MEFDPARYGIKVARILALKDNGNRLMPLDWGGARLTCEEEARRLLKVSPTSLFSKRAQRNATAVFTEPSEDAAASCALFPNAPEPREAMAGLWQYFDCFEEAHQLADACETPNGYYWHAIVHRREGDSANAAYWFHKTGAHPAYDALAAEAAKIADQYTSDASTTGRGLPGRSAREFRGGEWDPFAFVSFCDSARRQPGSAQERIAMEIQRAEWRILFDHCAASLPEQGPR